MATTATQTPRETRLALRVPAPRSGLRASLERFDDLCQANPDLRLERAPDGEVIVMAPSGFDSGRRNLSLAARLWIWNQACGLGIAADSSAGATLPNSAVRAPDAIWVRLERWTALSQAQRERFADVVPDFVAEIRSRSDSLPELREKMRESQDQGVRLAWLIDPKSETVEAYRPGRVPELLSRPETLSGEDVLPGFTLDLKGILFDEH